jgi:hypothetical protein
MRVEGPGRHGQVIGIASVPRQQGRIFLAEDGNTQELRHTHLNLYPEEQRENRSGDAT